MIMPSKYYSPPAPRPVKSGLVARSTDQVRFPQTWPHVALQDDLFNQGVEFKDLDFRLFVAGELEIITSPDISDRERSGRLQLLKQLTYLNGVHQWEILRNIYLSVVRKIELGSLHWGSGFMHDIQWVLTKHTVTQPARPGRTPKTASSTNDNRNLYCLEYNKGKCTFREGHYSNISGKQEWVKHFCSSCYRKRGIIAEHPRTDCNK